MTFWLLTTILITAYGQLAYRIGITKGKQLAKAEA